MGVQLIRLLLLLLLFGATGDPVVGVGVSAFFKRLCTTSSFHAGVVCGASGVPAPQGVLEGEFTVVFNFDFEAKIISAVS